MQVYFDESGDLGWVFNKPYQRGGSSRYLTIAFMFIEKLINKYPKRIVKYFYNSRKQSTQIELKGNSMSADEKDIFISKTIKMLKNQPEIKLAVITVKKENVFYHIREDKNILYNYMTKLIIPDYVKNTKTAELFPDPRTIKVKCENSMKDYLQTYLWFDLLVKTKLIKHTITSDSNLNIQFVDILANIIWESYEFNKRKNRRRLYGYLDQRELFFNK